MIKLSIGWRYSSWILILIIKFLLTLLIVEVFTNVFLKLIILFLLIYHIHLEITRIHITIFRYVARDFNARLSPITQGLRGNILDLLDQIASLVYFSS